MIALELFGCSGGMAEGFRRAGIPMSFAFDWDADACASYEANLHHRPVQIDVRDLVRLAASGWSPGSSVDLLIADPPCTPWSRAGKRKGLDDERDMLVETCELIRHLRPTRFLIGNVPGLDDGPALNALRRTIGALARLGYCVDYQRLDAANYGVPQHRHRPFWFGHLVGGCIRWPAPTHGDPKFTGAAHPGMAPRAGGERAPRDTSPTAGAEPGRPVKLRQRYDGGGRASSKHGSNPAAPARTVGVASLNDGNVLVITLQDIPQGKRRGRADAPAPTLSAKTARAGVGESMLEWPWGSPSTTVNGQGRLAPPGHHPESGSMLSLPDAIVLSEKAAAILQGFPDGWKFHGATKKTRWSQIGMAMPPPLAHAVATSVRAAMEAT